MKAKILLCSMLILGSLSYSAETTPKDSVVQEVMSEVKNIEAEYQALVQKEMERKEEFRQEKEALEKEVQEIIKKIWRILQQTRTKDSRQRTTNSRINKIIRSIKLIGRAVWKNL